MSRLRRREPKPTVYKRRTPEETFLHEVIRGHLETFVADAES